MTDQEGTRISVSLARRLAAELAEYGAEVHDGGTAVIGISTEGVGIVKRMSPDDELLVDYDRRIIDAPLREATRPRFVSKLYADAVEAGVKSLNECVRMRSGRTEDGDGLMSSVFSVNDPVLRLNKLQSKSDTSAQLGHMYLCRGVVAAWRNPRAHAILEDSPITALMMLETIQELMVTTRTAIKTRRSRKAATK